MRKIASDVRVDVKSFIIANMEVRRAPHVPELDLYRAHPGSGIGRLVDSENDPPPYWAYHWAGGTVIARHILDHPEVVSGLRVLDLGSGSGIVGIAAAKAGAGKVIAADTDPNALVATQLNALINGVNIEPMNGDVTIGDPPGVDLILAGDLFYDEATARRVTGFLLRCAAAGIQILIGDPGRSYLPRAHLRLIAEYLVSDFADAEGRAVKPSAVYAFLAGTI